MWRKLTHNWGLKLGSVIFAIMLWIIVTNINDPVLTYKVYNVPVTITNTDAITSKGEVYQVLDGTDKIDVVTITATRSIIDSLDDSNVIATADMNNLTMQNTIAIKLSTNKYSDKLESIAGNIDTVRLNVEDKKTVTMALTTTTSGDVGKGYQIGDISAEQNLVRISGPASVIDKVKKAAADVDVTGFTSEISTVVDIKLYDSDDKELSKESITMNISAVRVKVEILQTKSVPLSFKLSGTAASGYQANGVIDCNPDTITIAGKSSTIGKIESIAVSEEALNITGQAENMTTLVDVHDYLPTGVKLADGSFNGKVQVTVHIEKEEEKKLTLKNSSITVKGIPDGMTAEFVNNGEDDTGYDVTFSGLSSDIDKLSIDTVTAVADLDAYMKANGITELTTGVCSNVPVDLSYSGLTGTVETAEPMTVNIRLSETEGNKKNE